MREAPFPSFTVVRVGKSLIFPRFPQFVVVLLWEGWKSLRPFSTLSTALFPLSCIKSGKVALSLSSDLAFGDGSSRAYLTRKPACGQHQLRKLNLNFTGLTLPLPLHAQKDNPSIRIIAEKQIPVNAIPRPTRKKKRPAGNADPIQAIPVPSLTTSASPESGTGRPRNPARRRAPRSPCSPGSGRCTPDRCPP